MALTKSELYAVLNTARTADWNDEQEWNNRVSNNKDPYSGRIMLYAEEWARLMQVHMDAGVPLVSCAEADASMCDYDGITGFMYGAAVSALSRCWVHGDALRRWHNKKIQIGIEGEYANENGGVLNPALLNIG